MFVESPKNITSNMVMAWKMGFQISPFRIPNLVDEIKPGNSQILKS